MKVVEHHEKRDLLGDCALERPELVEELEARLRLVNLLERGGSGAQLRQETRKDVTIGSGDWLAARIAEHGSEDLDPRPERGSPSYLPAAPPVDRKSTLFGASPNLVRNPCLPDPWLTDQEKQSAGAGHGLLEAALELPELADTTDHRFGAQAHGSWKAQSIYVAPVTVFHPELRLPGEDRRL